MEKQYKKLNIFYIPAVVLMILFVAYPLFNAFYLSFFNWNGYSQTKEFFGFKNYISMFQDKNFRKALINTLIYGFGCTALQQVIGLALAMFLNGKFKGRSIVRTVIYMPAMVSGLVMGYIMYFFFQSKGGVINDMLLFPTMKSLNAKKDEGAAEENAAPKKDEPAAEDKAPEEMSAAASDADEKAASASVPQTPSVPAGEKLDAGISYEDALALLKKYNEDEFHIIHGETVARLMEYFARKYDPENETFWKVCGLLHDLDWEKWQDAVQHTVKTAELLQEAGVSPMVAHVIETHNSDNNPALPKPQHQMECVLWACDELSGLLGAIVRMYPSKSAQDLNLKSVKKKFKDKRFAAGCDRDNIARGAELNHVDLDTLFADMIEAYQATND